MADISDAKHERIIDAIGTCFRCAIQTD